MNISAIATPVPRRSTAVDGGVEPASQLLNRFNTWVANPKLSKCNLRGDTIAWSAPRPELSKKLVVNNGRYRRCRGRKYHPTELSLQAIYCSHLLRHDKYNGADPHKLLISMSTNISGFPIFIAPASYDMAARAPPRGLSFTTRR